MQARTDRRADFDARDRMLRPWVRGRSVSHLTRQKDQRASVDSEGSLRLINTIGESLL